MSLTAILVPSCARMPRAPSKQLRTLQRRLGVWRREMARELVFGTPPEVDRARYGEATEEGRDATGTPSTPTYGPTSPCGGSSRTRPCHRPIRDTSGVHPVRAALRTGWYVSMGGSRGVDYCFTF